MTLAIKSECHGASVAQVPAHTTKSRQSPTSTAQSRRPLFAASKSIKTNHLAPVPAKKAAACSVLTVPSGRPQLFSALQTPANCRAQRGFSYSICMPGRGSMPTDWLCVRIWNQNVPRQIDHGEDDGHALRARFGALRPVLGTSSDPTSVNDF